MAANVEPWGRGSLYHDLAHGGRLELDALNGEVVRRGREHGIQTPLNFAIYAALKPYINGTAVAGTTDGGKTITEWRCGPSTTNPFPSKYLPGSCKAS